MFDRADSTSTQTQMHLAVLEPPTPIHRGVNSVPHILKQGKFDPSCLITQAMEERQGSERPGDSVSTSDPRYSLSNATRLIALICFLIQTTFRGNRSTVVWL